MRSDTQRRAVLVGACLLGLLVVVALATRGNLGSSRSGSGPGPGFVDYVFTVFLVVFVLMIPLALWLWWMQRGEIVEQMPQTRKQRRWANLLTGMVLFALALWIAYVRSHKGFFGEHKPIKTPPTIAGKGSKGQPAGREPVFEWWLALLILGLVAAGVATGIVLWRREKRRRLLEETTAAEAVSNALDEALDDLREGDPREAVIRAYGRMETVLGLHGLPREPHEAPFEWLRRILVSLHASALSVERLAELFERARFSRHAIDEDMREDAIDALTAVRDELRAAVPA